VALDKLDEEAEDWLVELQAADDLRIIGVELRWHRLVQQLYSIRHLQRVFHNTGQRLKEVCERNLRERLSRYLK
jgi:transposase